MAKAAQKTDTQPAEESGDRPLIDTKNQELKKLIKLGKERGFISYEELNKALPQEQVSSEQIEDTMTMLSEMGINLVDAEEQDEKEAPAPQVVTTSVCTCAKWAVLNC